MVLRGINNLKILLVDVDSKIPNIALMKISTYHKNTGNDVDIIKLGLSGYPSSKKLKNIDAKEYDHAYASCIFTSNKDYFKIINCQKVDIGGSGIDIYKNLPKNIDDLDQDYSIYPENNWSYGFITRGCIRNCYFCVVPKKEGKLSFYRRWQDIVKFKYTDFLDNNFLAYDKHKKILQELNDNNIHFKFNSGLDIRLADKENMKLLSQSKYIGEFIFAFDNKKEYKIINNKMAIVQEFIPNNWRTKFDIYCHPDMPISDVIYRINWCRSKKALPYLMRDKDCWNSPNKNFYVDLASYCNQPGIFKKMNFDEFLNARHTGKNRLERINYSLNLWNTNI